MKNLSVLLFMALMISCSKESVKKAKDAKAGNPSDSVTTQEVQETYQGRTHTQELPPEEFEGTDQAGNRHFQECRFGYQEINGMLEKCVDDTETEYVKEYQHAHLDDEEFEGSTEQVGEPVYGNDRKARKAARQDARAKKKEKKATDKLTKQSEREKAQAQEDLNTREKVRLGKKAAKKKAKKIEAEKVEPVQNAKKKPFWKNVLPGKKEEVAEQTQNQAQSQSSSSTAVSNISIKQKRRDEVNPQGSNPTLAGNEVTQTQKPVKKSTNEVVKQEESVVITKVESKPVVLSTTEVQKPAVETKPVVSPPVVKTETPQDQAPVITIDDTSEVEDSGSQYGAQAQVDLEEAEVAPKPVEVAASKISLRTPIAWSDKMTIANPILVNGLGEEINNDGLSVEIFKHDAGHYVAEFLLDGNEHIVFGLEKGITFLQVSEGGDWGKGSPSVDGEIHSITTFRSGSNIGYTLELTKSGGDLVAVKLIKKEAGKVLDTLSIK